jgi:hypothetical protein
MRFFLMAALACCLVAMTGCASNFSLRGSEVQYRDRGLGKNQPFAAAGAYATTKRADVEGYEAETQRHCVEALSKALAERPDLAPYLSPAAQCGNGGWGYGGGYGYGGYGYGGGVSYSNYFPSPGTPYGSRDPNGVTLTNGSRSLAVQITMDGRPLGVLPPGERTTFALRFPPPAVPNRLSERQIALDLVWATPSGDVVGRSRAVLTISPRGGGSHRTLRPPP